MLSTLILKELRETLRETRSLVALFLTPTLLPLLFSLGISWFSGKGGHSVQHFRIAAPKPLIAHLNPLIRPYLGDTLQIRWIPTNAPIEGSTSVRMGTADLAFQETRKEADNPGVPSYTLLFTVSRPRSTRAKTAIQQVLDRALEASKEAFLQQQDYHPPFQIHASAVDAPVRRKTFFSEEADLFAYLVLLYVSVMFLLMATLQVVTDATAGERERRTLEALLSTAAPRAMIALAKVLVAAMAGEIAGLVSLATFTRVSLFGSRMISPETLLKASIGFLPLAFFGASLFGWIGGRSRSFREAQTVSSILLALAFLPLGMVLLNALEHIPPWLLLGAPIYTLARWMLGLPDVPLMLKTMSFHLLIAWGLTRLLARQFTRGLEP